MLELGKAIAVPIFNVCTTVAYLYVTSYLFRASSAMIDILQKLLYM